jgi:hypothetical protein
MGDPTLIVRSPTYTYYQKYTGEVDETREIGNRSETVSTLDISSASLLSPNSYSLSRIYHFDLYRLEDYATFVSIG